MASIDCLDIFLTEDHNILKTERKSVVTKLTNKFLSEDVENVINSKYNVLYRLVSNFGNTECFI